MSDDIQSLVTWIKGLVDHNNQLSAAKSQADDLTQKLQAEQSAHVADVQALQAKLTDLQNNFNADEQKIQTLLALMPSSDDGNSPTSDTSSSGSTSTPSGNPTPTADTSATTGTPVVTPTAPVGTPATPVQPVTAPQVSPQP